VIENVIDLGCCAGIIIIGFFVVGLAWGYVVAMARANRGPRGDVAHEKRRVARQAQASRSIDELLGLDKALAAKFYRSLRKALASGEVKVALAREDCDGYITYDFVRESWICVERMARATGWESSQPGRRSR